jgi:hypothetical protein
MNIFKSTVYNILNILKIVNKMNVRNFVFSWRKFVVNVVLIHADRNYE